MSYVYGTRGLSSMAGPSKRHIVSFAACTALVVILFAAQCANAEPALETADSQTVQVRARMTTEDSFLRTCDPDRDGRYNWPPSQENCPVIKKIPKGSYVTPFCTLLGQPVGTPPNRDPWWVYVEFGTHRGFMPDYFIKCAGTPDACGMRICSGQCCPSYVSGSYSPFDFDKHTTPITQWALTA